MHGRGQVTAFDIAERMAADTDEGDAGKAERLRRRRDSLRAQLAEAQELLAPPQWPETDPVAAAAQRARDVHREFVTAALAELAAAREGRPAPRERRPFASRGGGPLLTARSAPPLARRVPSRRRSTRGRSPA